MVYIVTIAFKIEHDIEKDKKWEKPKDKKTIEKEWRELANWLLSSIYSANNPSMKVELKELKIEYPEEKGGN